MASTTSRRVKPPDAKWRDRVRHRLAGSALGTRHSALGTRTPYTPGCASIFACPVSAWMRIR